MEPGVDIWRSGEALIPTVTTEYIAGAF